MTDLIFRKANLHIHTPASLCYNDKSVTPEQIVNAALAGGLDVIAITDHNTFDAVENIRDIAQKKGLCVFPGIELSTKGGHFTALFEIDSTLNELIATLELLQPERNSWGDGTAILEGNTEEIIKQIALRGGIAIAAHIERWPSGFLESGETSRVKMNIHASPYLSALEITIPQDRISWNNGKMLNYPKKYACIQGSDAHNLDEIGRRPVYIKMESCNLEALKSAFQDYEDRIAFPDDISKE
ncbi:PHP domain-containing protein [Chloroflexota bacterium]